MTVSPTATREAVRVAAGGLGAPAGSKALAHLLASARAATRPAVDGLCRFGAWPPPPSAAAPCDATPCVPVWARGPSGRCCRLLHTRPSVLAIGGAGTLLAPMVATMVATPVLSRCLIRYTDMLYRSTCCL